MSVEELREEPMMAHLLDALHGGESIGEFGRLVFAIVARHFLPEKEVVASAANPQAVSPQYAINPRGSPSRRAQSRRSRRASPGPAGP